MRNLIQFILRFKDFFLFLTLQVFAFYFLFSSNVYHNAVFATSSNEVVAGLYDIRNNFNEYLKLKQNNKTIAQENARLMTRQRSSYRRVDHEYVLVDDTLMMLQYRYVPAKVINSSANKQKNFLTLNRGTVDGLAPNQAVVTERGVVGIVRNTSKHFATVIPIINVAFELSVETKGNHHFGLVRWGGKSPRTARIDDMAKHAEVELGDTIVTRGSSAIFPPGVPVGVISRIGDVPGSNFHDIDIELITSYNSLNYVYVIRNILQKEQLELEAEEQ